MEYTYEDLENKTVAQLREIAEKVEHEAVHGYKTMHKEHLVKALCEAFGIEARVQREIVGISKGDAKAQIRKLKEKRAEAIAAHDHKELKMVRRKIHRLKRKMRKATV